MKFVIETAREVFLVRDESALRQKQAKAIAKAQRFGVRVQIHESNEPKTVRVDHGRWIFDCECGSGVPADPEMTRAYCMGCGAIHTQVVFPDADERLNIEHVLVSRKNSANRNWAPGERLLDIATENAEHGVKF